ncbi:uncharacterized protein LOC108911568 [Anoplophora glabripennis]|uniref:uncharacterized protein LOC108911568 n=1 Tax=Anoplophora glabripennis TaxID=217634 RepID=UPI000873A4A2|nr:uncharacterized protein LOC108911568 [Anoplophora glabripennis]XP_018572059.1 uncharacterized protein LOC108911568 [Anoplophora glabripennis]
MANFKQQREIENKIHEQLYESLFLLSQFYPTSKEFNTVFKKDMFVKNNKAAFFEVAYYLLNTLNPELTKEKLMSWPPYDIKRENKFRIEVLNYINELNVLYDNADIPHIMSSHLISPGGIKFTKFILKLSQLVMYEHLNRTQVADILYCPKPSKNVSLTKVNLNNLKKKTALIEKETSEMIKNFQSFHFDSNEKALVIDSELNKLNDSIRLAKKENEEVREEFNKNHPYYPPMPELEEKITSLKCQYEGFQEVHKLFKDCESLLSYLKGNDLVLEYSKEKEKLPKEVLHVEENREELDLIQFFHRLNVLLEKKALEFPYPTSSFISENTQKIEELCVQHTEVKNVLSQNMKELQSVLEKISREIKAVVEVTNANETEEVLAVPLSDSLKSK